MFTVCYADVYMIVAREELQNINLNIIRRAHLCIGVDGKHFLSAFWIAFSDCILVF